MKVLITSAGDNLTGQIANSLGDDHEILLTDREDVSTRFPFVRSDLNHTQPTNDLVRGVDVIVHSGAVDPRASVSDQLDYQMRCTYNLLKAAWEEGVPRVVYLSSLRLMEGYDPSYAVTERWNRRPRWSRRSFAVTSARSCAGSSHGSERSKSRFSGSAKSHLPRNQIPPRRPCTRTTRWRR